MYFLDSTYKGYHTVFVFLCLSHFTWHNALQLDVCCCKLQNFIFLCMCAKSFQSCLMLYSPMMCSLPGSSVNRILQAWILEWVAIFFSILYAQTVFHCLYRSHLLYSFICVRHSGWVRILAILNNAAMNFEVCISFEISVFGFWRYMPRSRIAGLYGNFIFSILRNLHITFSSCCINLHSHQQCTRVSFHLLPCQHLLFVFFSVIAFFQV